MKHTIIFIITSITILSGCSNHINNNQDTFDYSVINYSSNDFANVRINNEGIANVEGAKFLGSYESSGQYCCITFNRKKSPIIEYSIINQDRSSVLKNKNAIFLDRNAEGSNLVLHILPNENFLIEFTNELPDPSKKILDSYLQKNKMIRQDLDSPSTWR